MSGNIKVVIVDDESRIRQGIERLVLNNGDEWEVVGTYINGLECLQDIEARNVHFDVLFTDMKMPVMSGLELLARLNEMTGKSYRSVVVSGYDDFEFIQSAMREGAMDYLLKPVDRQEMKKCLNKIKAIVLKNGTASQSNVKNISIELATQWIQDHLGEALTIEKIAAQVFMNPTYFSEYFKRKTGITVLDYVTKKRLEKALNLLQSTNMKVYAISETIGYNDTKYFSKLFKKHYGLLPSQLRNI